jgi:glycosyltransferase involved in cell wall biosynthesis
MAIGEYVCFLDSDDFYHRDFLLRTLNKLLLSPESAGVFCTTVSTKGGINRGSDQTASNIMPNLFLRNRPWSTSSWLWRKSEISEWKQLRTNEDWMFEIDTASINNSIVHIAEPLCIKDDDTGENTKDLVDYKTPEIHRDTVAKYALNKLNSYSNHQFYDRIKKAVIKRLVFTSSRLILLKEEREVRKNGLLIIRHNLPLALLLLLLSVTTFNSISIAGFYKRLLNRIHNVL